MSTAAAPTAQATGEPVIDVVTDPAIAAADPANHGDPFDALEALEARVAAVCGSLNMLHAQLVELAAEAIETEAWAGGGVRSVEHWLAWQTGLSPRRAREVTAIARRRAELPVTMERFTRGELAIDQVVPVVAHAASHNDAEVAEFATYATVSQLRSTLSRYRPAPEHDPTDPDPEPAPESAPDPEAGSEPAPGLARGSLSMYYGDDRFRLVLDAPADVGALVEAALKEAKDGLIAAGVLDVTWADAFVEVCNRSLSAVSPTGRMDKYRVYLHLDTAGGWLNAGMGLPDSLTDKICCHGSLQPVWETSGTPVNVGRSQRIVPERTRRLVEDRDRGCRHPTCQVGRYVEIHHLISWRNGGPTDMANLLSLCPFHHDALHRGEYHISGDPNEVGGLVFTRDDGRIIAPAGKPRPPDPGRPPPTPPDGHRYRHPTGETLQTGAVCFSPPPAPAPAAPARSKSGQVVVLEAPDHGTTRPDMWDLAFRRG
jgi:hypothetical protein